MNRFLLFLLLPFLGLAQNTFQMGNKESAPTNGSIEIDINKDIKGTLLLPNTDKPIPLVILFTGIGPNDRNGNSMMNRSDSHKQLAAALDSAGIATYRYDKRTFTMLKENRMKDDVSFDDFVTDAKAVIHYFDNDKRFSKTILAGHSQGSLVAMLAMDESIDGFISIAGPADPIDQTIVQQVATQAPGLDKELEQVFKKMKSQDSLVSKINPYLISVVGPQVQPFMKSWMKYDPKEVIKDLEIPVLVVNGTRDRQVDVAQAEKLHAALPESKLVIVENMDHLFKKVGKDDIEAAKSNTDPRFPLHPELVASIISFVKQ